MNKTLVKSLTTFAQELEKRYSHKERENNYNNETFKIFKIIPLSDHAASVIFKKNTGKQVAFFCYFINSGLSKGWKYFVPTDSHIVGMINFNVIKLKVEENNYKYNFND